jgi:tripartite-type tricarboxylate transporter receptor subunit TctC
MPRRELNKALAVAAVLWPLAAQAQTYPSRPVVMVEPYAAGGSSTSWAAFWRRA